MDDRTRLILLTILVAAGIIYAVGIWRDRK